MKDDIYKELATAIVKKQAEIIGRQLAVRKVHKLSDILMDEEGNILKLGPDPVNALSAIVHEFMNLSGNAALKFSQDATAPFLKNDPALPLPPELKSDSMKPISS